MLGSRDLKKVGEVESVLFYVHVVVYSICGERNSIIEPVPTSYNHLLEQKAPGNQIAQNWQGGWG